MGKYFVLDGVTYDLDPRTEAAGPVGGIKLSDILVGDTFKLGDHEMVVLEHSKDTTAVIKKDLLTETNRFGDNNNFNGSDADKRCVAFARSISRAVRGENLVEFTVDLTSDDGLKDYGKVRRKAALLTADLYRRYVLVLDKHRPECWWWLATPHSAPTHKATSWVKCVSPSGCISSSSDLNNDFGVRPFCILKSCIFVSK